MTIDMTQFHQVFFEESFEGLGVMESGLLDMDPGAVEAEEINAIFRAAHSIKGAAVPSAFRTSRILPISWKRCSMRCGTEGGR